MMFLPSMVPGAGLFLLTVVTPGGGPTHVGRDDPAVEAMDPGHRVRPTGADSALRSLAIGRYLVTLGAGFTFEGVQGRLGKTLVSESRDRHNDWSICYTMRTKGGHVELRFLSDELGGPEHEVLGFDVRLRGAKVPPSADCSSKLPGPLELLAGGRRFLGMTRLEVRRAMGAPTRAAHREYEYEHSREVIGADGRRYDANNKVLIEFEGGRVTRLWAWYAEIT